MRRIFIIEPEIYSIKFYSHQKTKQKKKKTPMRFSCMRKQCVSYLHDNEKKNLFENLTKIVLLIVKKIYTSELKLL